MSYLAALPFVTAAAVQIVNALGSAIFSEFTKKTLAEIESKPVPAQDTGKILVRANVQVGDVSIIMTSDDGVVYSNAPAAVFKIVSRDRDAAAALTGFIAVATPAFVQLSDQKFISILVILSVLASVLTSYLIVQTDPVTYSEKKILRVFSRYTAGLTLLNLLAAAAVWIFAT